MLSEKEEWLPPRQWSSTNTNSAKKKTTKFILIVVQIILCKAISDKVILCKYIKSTVFKIV